MVHALLERGVSHMMVRRAIAHLGAYGEWPLSEAPLAVARTGRVADPPARARGRVRALAARLAADARAAAAGGRPAAAQEILRSAGVAFVDARSRPPRQCRRLRRCSAPSSTWRCPRAASSQRRRRAGARGLHGPAGPAAVRLTTTSSASSTRRRSRCCRARWSSARCSRGAPRGGRRGARDDARRGRRRRRSSSRCWPSSASTRPVHYMGPEAYPSGHTTAVMSLALALDHRQPGALAAAGRRGRRAADGRDRLLDPACSAAHYPSDIVGGFLVATGWACLASRGAAARARPSVARAGAGRARCWPRWACWLVALRPGGARSPTRRRTRRSSSARWRSPPARSCSAEASRLPERLRAARRDIHPTREDEQQVAEPVEVAHALRVDAPRRRRSCGAPRAGRRCGRRAAGRPRACRRAARRTSAPAAAALASSQACSSHFGLLGDHPQPLALAALGDRDVGADVEEVVLDRAASQPAYALGQAAAARARRRAGR